MGTEQVLILHNLPLVILENNFWVGTTICFLESLLFEGGTDMFFLA